MKSLSKTASSHTTSQVTWPNDNKAVGNCFHALIAGLRPASLILARRIAFPLFLLGAALVLIQPCAGQSGTWTPTGSLRTARDLHTATSLPNGKVLVAGGLGADLASLASAELYDPARGTWTTTGNLPTARVSHTATLLPNGKVLVAGGSNTSSNLASAELYDPASGTWTSTGSLGTARQWHTATLLPNGKVLAAGGFNGGAPLASAELYDPASGTWSTTGSLGTGRDLHTATLLPNGNVLVAGGIGASGGILASAELYHPASGTWTTTGSLGTARYHHTATLLPNGKVLVAGGFNGRAQLASAELYEPALRTWSATGTLGTARRDQTATLLLNGNVLVAGGIGASFGFLVNAELYDPASGTWSATGSLVFARCFHTATLLLNGQVLIAAGAAGNSSDFATAELYNTPAPLSTLGNISTRAFVQTGDNVLIGGFIITGTHTKRVLLRAIGPSLALAGKLMNPTMELHDSSGALIVSNDNWGSASNHQEIANTGAAPTNALESAIVRSLAPGRYTAIVRGVGNTTGIALVEGYDLDRTVDSKFANISSRGLVQTGDNVMIGGFIVLGAGSQKVIIRAIGPSLPLAGKLSNPTLELHNAQGALMASNDNWRTTQQAEIIATGIPPSNNLESAIVRTLTPGAYTAIVRGVSNTTGLALVEVYALN